MDSGDVHKFMGLEGYFPSRVIFHVLNDLRSELGGLAPLGLKAKFAAFIHQLGMILRKIKISLIIYDHFQLVCFSINGRMWLFEFLWRKAHPIKVSRKWMRSGSFDIGSESLFLQQLSQRIEVIHQRFASGDDNQSSRKSQSIFNDFLNG